MSEDSKLFGRRKILTGLGTGIAAIGAVTASRDAVAAKHRRWKPAMEKQDDWMEFPGRHRLVFDAISPNGAGDALFFASNYIDLNKSAYDLDPSQLANLVIFRHFATIFGYNDTVWAKYGAAFAKMTNFMNPKTSQAPKRNLYDAEGFGESLTNRGATISGLGGKGVHFAVCGLATQKIAEMLAPQMNAKVDDVHADFAGNLIPNARLVSAGIVAVNRAQERGYAVAYTG